MLRSRLGAVHGGVVSTKAFASYPGLGIRKPIMEHTPIERKLITLALDPAAREGEVANAATMLFRSLRKRAVTAQQFSTNSSASEYALRDKMNKLNQTIKELNQTINNQAQLIRLHDEERMHRKTPPPLPITPRFEEDTWFVKAFGLNAFR
jgi:hypothetical protein